MEELVPVLPLNLIQDTTLWHLKEENYPSIGCPNAIQVAYVVAI